MEVGQIGCRGIISYLQGEDAPRLWLIYLRKWWKMLQKNNIQEPEEAAVAPEPEENQDQPDEGDGKCRRRQQLDTNGVGQSC
ncbi:hypothetical protein NQ317_001613 [Molorchus minor]|uniref:Uncharacterized protein n=1 Tax=Molorchus minor TaxID=1323400 RepID=A0ABQ9JQA8_9CUCU|nr:hypothetical protein NQ317_001613 [Molorchus minor]